MTEEKSKMRSIRCLIVEDEPLAAEVLQDYIEQMPQLELVAVCTDALYALEALQQYAVDVMFLDIHLPKLKGLDFLRTLNNPPQVILTTAYHQYALQGYEYNVVDYLLKPIEFSRFMQAINKLEIESEKAVISPVVTSNDPARVYRFFTANKRKIKVFLDEILYVESLKEYVRVFTISKNIVTKFQIGEMESFLEDQNFLRIHRSFLVAKDKIESFTASEVEINGQIIPIGRSYRREIGKILDTL